MKQITRAWFAAMACNILVLAPLGASGKTPFLEGSMVRQKCSACHKIDTQGCLEVIEETRKSPEEWKVVVDRMVRLNSAPVADEDFNAVIKELSWNLCLCPSEMATVHYFNSGENSQYREIPKNDLEKRIYTACVRCHTWGKIASHRNTPGQWAEVRVLHLGLYPTAVLQMREMNWPKEFEELLPDLSRLFPYDSGEWRQWMETRSKPDLGGTWKTAGYQPGYGYYTGRYVFHEAPDIGTDEYRIEREIGFEQGSPQTFSGQGTLYGGYHLRYALRGSSDQSEIEGVFDLDVQTMSFSGTWWKVVQDTNAFGSEKVSKLNGDPAIMAVFPQSIKKGAKEPQYLRFIGVNLPENITTSEITFSDEHISVKEIRNQDSTELLVRVEAGSKAAVGRTHVAIRDIPYHDQIVVFDTVQGIRIIPDLGRARVSCGPHYPPQGVQFVARAVNFGPDGKADTSDDALLEEVKATWWLEEQDTSVSTLMKGLRVVGIYPKFGREVDDDLAYLKAPVDNGLYTPVTTYEPLKRRVQHVEGTGLIAIGASCTIDGKEHKGRSLLAVTVPDFVPHIK